MKKVLFLGTGSSMGVPVIGCGCSVCISSSSKNKRFRSSVLIDINGKKFLIDAGPDFRMQALKYRIFSIDALLLTHGHYDHIGGLEDLRILYFIQDRKPILSVLSKETEEEIRNKNRYLFMPVSDFTSESVRFDFHALSSDAGTIEILNEKIHYFSYFQAETKITGYRIDDFAYVTDIRNYSEEIFNELKGVKVLVLSALRHYPSKVHFSIREAIDFVKNLQVERVYLTHIAHEIDHEKVNRELPAFMHLAYDGLEIFI